MAAARAPTTSSENSERASVPPPNAADLDLSEDDAEAELPYHERGLTPGARAYLDLMRRDGFVYSRMPKDPASLAATARPRPLVRGGRTRRPMERDGRTPHGNPFGSHLKSGRVIHQFALSERWPDRVNLDETPGPGGLQSLGRIGSLNNAAHLVGRRPAARETSSAGPGAYSPSTKGLQASVSAPHLAPPTMRSRLSSVRRPAQASYSPSLDSLPGTRSPGTLAYSFPVAPRAVGASADGTERLVEYKGHCTPPAMGPGFYTLLDTSSKARGGRWSSPPAAVRVNEEVGLGPGRYDMDLVFATTAPAGAKTPAYSFAQYPYRPPPSAKGLHSSATKGVYSSNTDGRVRRPASAVPLIGDAASERGMARSATTGGLAGMG